MTSSPTRSRPAHPDPHPDPHPEPVAPPRFQLSVVQVIASALAAITATVAASYLGIAGTVIGAAVASVLTVTGNAVYSHSLRRTGTRVATVVPAAARLVPRATIVTRAPAAAAAPHRPRGRWTTAVAACLGVFAGVLLVVTAVEVVAGRPLSDVVRGEQGSGTTVLGSSAGRAGTTPTTPTPRVTVTVTPSVVTTTPTVTVTGTPVTRTAQPTATPTTTSPTTTTPTATPTPTAPATSSPSGSPTGSSATGSASSTG